MRASVIALTASAILMAGPGGCDRKAPPAGAAAKPAAAKEDGKAAATKGPTSPKELILGKWVGTEGRGSMPLDFRDDGTFTVTIDNPAGRGKPITSVRTYKWTADDRIETTVKGLKDKILLVDVKVTKVELTYKAKTLGEVFAEGKYKRAK